MFKKVLWPAIRLMGQLSYAAKFGLISFLFMVPLVILSGQVFYASYQSLKKTESELVAVYNIQEIMAVVYAIEDFRNHAAPLVFQQDAELKARMLDYRGSVDIQFKKAMNKIDNTELKEQLTVFSKNHLSKLSIDGDSRMPTLPDQFNYYQQVIEQLYLVINKYAQSTGLALDSDPEVQQLMLITLSNSPVIRNAAGVGYAAGIFAMIEKYLQSMTYDLMNDVFDQMSGVGPDIQLITSSLESLGLVTIAQQAKIAGAGMTDIQMTIDEEVIAATNINMTWLEFEAFSQPKIEALKSLDNTLFPLIAKKLQTRLDEQNSYGNDCDFNSRGVISYYLSLFSLLFIGSVFHCSILCRCAKDC